MTRLCNLPRLNPSASRLLEVSSDVDSAQDEFEAIFRSDPSLAVELLRVANSARFELRAAVPSIHMALMLLGTDGTRNLAFTIAMGSYLRGGLSESQVRPLWLHSVATAVIAEQIGHCIAPELTDLYTAGLTHDLGRLGLLHADERRYEEILGKVFSSMDEANALEKVLFGLTHAEAGGHLAQTWSFPPALCRSIRAHHDPLTEDDGRLLRINQQACILAGELGYQELPNCPIPEADHSLFEGFRNRPELAHERLKAQILSHIQSTA
ncbi:MAG: HDOD domain-containing protein [Candidatus Solibacter sp.]